MPAQSYNCPECGSEEFVTQPNRYDVLTFTAMGFHISDTCSTDDIEIIFCRECGNRVDIEQSLSANNVVLLP
ncbi:MAG: hypothetical protein MUF71_19645 [Candidatus Kapabacteria bacterium]|nr:hypothetical protein [Candidatus Kapabacteria bacterium]